MKKQAIYIGILISLAIVASCSVDPVEFEESISKGDLDPQKTIGRPETIGSPDESEIPADPMPETRMGAFSYSGKVPGNGKASKVPTCKEGEPETVLFEITDMQGNGFQREMAVNLENGLWVSETDSLPVGNYTVTGTTLMSDTGEPLYALPNKDEPDFTDYVEASGPSAEPTQDQLENGILPIDIQIGATPVTISGTALCYIPSDIEVDGGFGPGISTEKLQTLVVYVTGKVENPDAPIFDSNENVIGYEKEGCIDVIYVVVDNYRVIERYAYTGSYIRYPLVVPTEYDTMKIYTSDDQSANSNVTQSYSFTRENPYDPEIHGALIFDKCDQQIENKNP